MKKFILHALMGNKTLMLEVFLMIAGMLAKETDNDIDDQLVEMLRDFLAATDQ